MIKSRIHKVLEQYMYKCSEERIEDRFLLGKVMLEAKRNIWREMAFEAQTWDEFGFGVFSQSNEDGLIQYLINKIDIPNKTFIEFGVQNYTECNTRFLLMNNYWSGLIMDGSGDNMRQLRDSLLYWKHNIQANNVFITKENINQLISDWDESKSGDVGILSIDIDGVDYWVWESIDCIEPYIVICEFNPIFGPEAMVTIPYQADFYRTKAHYSNLYWGASLNAYVSLAKRKGYKLVCLNQMGNNAFFVREEEQGVSEVSTQEAYRGLRYRDSRNKSGGLTYLSREEGVQLIGDELVIDLKDNLEKRIRDCI